MDLADEIILTIFFVTCDLSLKDLCNSDRLKLFKPHCKQIESTLSGFHRYLCGRDHGLCFEIARHVGSVLSAVVDHVFSCCKVLVTDLSANITSRAGRENYIYCVVLLVVSCVHTVLCENNVGTLWQV